MMSTKTIIFQMPLLVFQETEPSPGIMRSNVFRMLPLMQPVYTRITCMRLIPIPSQYSNIHPAICGGKMLSAAGKCNLHSSWVSFSFNSYVAEFAEATSTNRLRCTRGIRILGPGTVKTKIIEGHSTVDVSPLMRLEDVKTWICEVSKARQSSMHFIWKWVRAKRSANLCQNELLNPGASNRAAHLCNKPKHK